MRAAGGHQSERPTARPAGSPPSRRRMRRGGRARRSAGGVWGGAGGGAEAHLGGRRPLEAGLGGGTPAMLITLCYLYLWARWGPCSAALIRRTVRRLHRSRCSFIFCCSAGPSAPPAHPPRRPAPPEERVCLRIGNKVFFTDETQVRAGEGGEGEARSEGRRPPPLPWRRRPWPRGRGRVSAPRAVPRSPRPSVADPHQYGFCYRKLRASVSTKRYLGWGKAWCENHELRKSRLYRGTEWGDGGGSEARSTWRSSA